MHCEGSRLGTSRGRTIDGVRCARAVGCVGVGSVPRAMIGYVKEAISRIVSALCYSPVVVENASIKRAGTISLGD